MLLEQCLNPCCNGMLLKVFPSMQEFALKIICLNPCCNGMLLKDKI